MANARGGAWRTIVAGRLGDLASRNDLFRQLVLLTALPAVLASPAWAQNTPLPTLPPPPAPAQNTPQPALPPSAARAQGWDIVPTLTVAETYTDNVVLAQEALKQSDWVTQVIPGISIVGNGPRLRLNATYTPEFLYYAKGTRESDVLHRGNAVGTAELAENLLFVEGGARVDQYNISLQGPLTTGNVNVTENRTTATNAYVTPYLQRDFGSSIRGEAKYTLSTFRSDNPTVIADNVANRINLRLTNGPARKVFTWDFAYKNERIDYETQQETFTEVFTADAQRLITSTVGLLGQAGYEKYDSGIPGAFVEDSRWSAGIEWTPTPRTRLVATGGQRFFGDTYGFDFRHRTRLTTWSASYSEDVTTARAQFYVPATGNTATSLDQLFVSQFPDPATRQQAVEQFIAQTGLPPSLGAPVNFFTEQLYLVKTGQASAALTGVRHTLIANAYTETRELVFAGLVQPGIGDFAASNTIRQIGASLAWTWRVTARNAWNLGAGFIRREFLDIDRVDDLTVFRMGLTRQFQPHLSGSLTYRRQDNESNQTGLSYTENAGTASLRMTF